MKLRTKIKVFESSIIPVLTYGAQTWACTKNRTKKINTTQNATLGNILKIKIEDRVSISEIVKLTKVKKVGRISKRLKLKYAGHIARESGGKWNKYPILWEPKIKRRRGSLVMRRMMS